MLSPPFFEEFPSQHKMPYKAERTYIMKRNQKDVIKERIANSDYLKNAVDDLKYDIFKRILEHNHRGEEVEVKFHYATWTRKGSNSDYVSLCCGVECEEYHDNFICPECGTVLEFLTNSHPIEDDVADRIAFAELLTGVKRKRYFRCLLEEVDRVVNRMVDGGRPVDRHNIHDLFLPFISTAPDADLKKQAVELNRKHYEEAQKRN